MLTNQNSDKLNEGVKIVETRLGKHMIYTSYFGNLKKLPADIEPIAICGGIPDWYKGKWFKKLAPSWSIWKEWHDSNSLDKNEHYIERFKEEILRKLNPEEILHKIFELTDEGKIPCLICYEKPGDFCHRHLVADWLNENLKDEKIFCEEFSENMSKGKNLS